MAAMPFQHSTTGFYNAPVSKGLLGCMFITSCALNVPLLAHLKKYFAWSYPDIFIRYEVWRLVTSKITFLDTKDLICGSLLIYYFRIFERRYGSRKYASCLLATSVVSTLLELAIAAALQYFEIDETPVVHQSGPYGFIFPMFVNYFFDIPRVAQTYILSIPVTGKTLTYLLGLQMLSSSRTSAFSSLCGIISGIIYKYNVLKVQQIIRVPSFIAKFANFTFGWLLKSSPPQDGAVPMGATLEIQRQQHLEVLEQQMLLNHARELNRNRNAAVVDHNFVPADYGGDRFYGNPEYYGIQEEIYTGVRQRAGHNNAPQGNEEPNDLGAPGPSVREEQVQQLVEMGFDRQSVLEALRTSNYDINVATNMLLQDS